MQKEDKCEMERNTDNRAPEAGTCSTIVSLKFLGNTWSFAYFLEIYYSKSRIYLFCLFIFNRSESNGGWRSELSNDDPIIYVLKSAFQSLLPPPVLKGFEPVWYRAPFLRMTKSRSATKKRKKGGSLQGLFLSSSGKEVQITPHIQAG